MASSGLGAIQELSLANRQHMKFCHILPLYFLHFPPGYHEKSSWWSWAGSLRIWVLDLLMAKKCYSQWINGSMDQTNTFNTSQVNLRIKTKENQTHNCGFFVRCPVLASALAAPLWFARPIQGVSLYMSSERKWLFSPRCQIQGQPNARAPEAAKWLGLWWSSH